ncbi:hypothetical protein TNCV_4852811 [Trichonephila clavipes]|nr:hypothetical protein TNCV_4852811 [Trichonephila clavipes]
MECCTHVKLADMHLACEIAGSNERVDQSSRKPNATSGALPSFSRDSLVAMVRNSWLECRRFESRGHCRPVLLRESTHVKHVYARCSPVGVVVRRWMPVQESSLSLD